MSGCMRHDKNKEIVAVRRFSRATKPFVILLDVLAIVLPTISGSLVNLRPAVWMFKVES